MHPEQAIIELKQQIEVQSAVIKIIVGSLKLTESEKDKLIAEAREKISSATFLLYQAEERKKAGDKKMEALKEWVKSHLE